MDYQIGFVRYGFYFHVDCEMFRYLYSFVIFYRLKDGSDVVTINHPCRIILKMYVDDQRLVLGFSIAGDSTTNELFFSFEITYNRKSHSASEESTSS